MLTRIRMVIARQRFRAVRETLYRAIARDLESADSKTRPTDGQRFAEWEKRAAERGELVAHAHAAVRRRLQADGKSLSDALEPLVPIEEVIMIDGGLAAGKLAQALHSVIAAKEATEKMNSIVQSAMTQPAVSGISIVGLSLLYGLMIWPPLMDAFPARYWDGWALPLVRAQIWFANHAWLTLMPLALTWLYWWTLPRWTGRIRVLVDRLPPWNAIRDRNAANLLSVLASLIQSGATIEAALARIQSRSTPYMQWHIAAMRRRLVLYGDDFLKVLDTGLLSRAILDQIADAASSRSFDKALEHMGSSALSDVIKIVKRTAWWANGVLVALAGSVFLYITAVQLIAVDQAGTRYSDSFMSGKHLTK
ncbi:hypothetical protein FX016_23055 [Cupriavidus gilardii]|nr:hypothetical protein FX016_23055 [Cupriavidus gilardii]